jgi:hypothetical protein
MMPRDAVKCKKSVNDLTPATRSAHSVNYWLAAAAPRG